jgi:hypothetical protein
MGRKSGPLLELLLHVDRAAREPLHIQVERGLREAIRGGRMAAGAPVPSSRALARELGVPRRRGHRRLRATVRRRLPARPRRLTHHRRRRCGHPPPAPRHRSRERPGGCLRLSPRRARPGRLPGTGTDSLAPARPHSCTPRHARLPRPPRSTAVARGPRRLPRTCACHGNRPGPAVHLLRDRAGPEARLPSPACRRRPARSGRGSLLALPPRPASSRRAGDPSRAGSTSTDSGSRNSTT